MTPGSGTAHIGVFDGMRGIAILLVVLFHYRELSFWEIKIPALGSQGNFAYIQIAGSYGVQLFFFISGFCLCYPHAKAMFGLGSVPTLKDFYYRRAIKIVPSYLLALFVLGIFFTSLYPSNFRYGEIADVTLHLAFLHNLFPETRSSFDSVLWSLGVEVQFYYLFPLLARRFRRRPWGVAVGMTAVAVAWRYWLRAEHAGDASLAMQLPSFLDLFAFGMLAAYLILWIQQRPGAVHRLRMLFTAMAFLSVLAILMMFRWVASIADDGAAELWKLENTHWLGLLFLCFAVCSAFSITFWRRVLSNRVLVFFSAISYNLYIWHQAVGQLIFERGWWRAYVPEGTQPRASYGWRWTFTLVGVGLSVLIATLITYGFERPLLRHGVRGVARALRSPLVSSHVHRPPKSRPPPSGPI